MNWIWLNDRAYNMNEIIMILIEKDPRDISMDVLILECKDEGIRRIRYSDKKEFDSDLALIKSLCYKQGGE